MLGVKRPECIRSFSLKAMDKNIIVALDFDSGSRALKFIDQLDPNLCRVKVGKELFAASGPQLIRDIVAREFDVFLDLKFHDIPNTVAKAVSVVADLDIWMLNVHASGGMAMLKAARQSLESFGDDKPLLVGVTVLTSLGGCDLEQIGVSRSPEEQVIKLASLAQDAGLDGVVCSAVETKILRARLSNGFILVTPGIRRPEDSNDDQKRVVGPTEAVKNGSNYIVVGRPITQSAYPNKILREFDAAISSVS